MNMISVEFTLQQIELLERRAATAGADVPSLVRSYIASGEDADPRDLRVSMPVGSSRRNGSAGSALDPGEERLRLTLEPVTGRAIPVQKGEVLRLRQIEGQQCVDFNAFNLHDYKEYMSVGHSRRQGFHLAEGDVLLTNSPRLRPMLLLAYVPETCVVDTLAARCTAPLFEMQHGFRWHTNCQDTLAEAIREYDLTPDDVHDSCNMFQNTRWDSAGLFWSERNSAQAGDYIDLVACMDVLAVPVVCGSGDVTLASNFWLRPVEVSVFATTSATSDLVQQTEGRFRAPQSRRGPGSYRLSAIKSDRELKANQDYQAQFPSAPLGSRTIDIEVPANAMDTLSGTAGALECSEPDAARWLAMRGAVLGQ